MINYPHKLNTIFEKLKNLHAKPILVGGFVRDSILGIKSKDIDVEVYGIPTYEKLQNILEEFGSVNSVGKSFGVCKLEYDGLDLDFSLPRKDNKVKNGHSGFEVEINPNMEFKTATSRRDFTINAMGYDILEKKLLDPFNGLDDLKNRTLKMVDIKTFSEDPLRVLRAVQFCARFELKIDAKLFSTCKEMVKNSILDELPKQRIYDEIKKLLLKSNKPSIGFKLLQQFGFLDENFDENIKNIDKFVKFKTSNHKIDLAVMLALLYKNKTNNIQTFIDDKTKIREIKNLLHVENNFKTNTIFYNVIKEVNFKNLELFLMVLNSTCKDIEVLKPRVHGKDLINVGFKPSKDFSKLLQLFYEVQQNLTTF